MAYQGDTPEASDNVPKIPNTIRRNGVYYFNARYPRDLPLELTGGKSHFRKSLETKDWKKAKQVATREALHFQLEVEKLEQQWKGTKESNNAEKLPFKVLTEEQKRDLVFRWFVSREKGAESFRDDWTASDDDLWKNEALGDARLDHSDISSFDSIPLSVWEKKAAAIIAEDGFQATDEEIIIFAHQIRKAEIEIGRRTLIAMNSAPKEPENPLFRDLYSHSSVNARPAKTRTIGELCAKYQQDKKVMGVTTGTLSKYQMQIRILKDFLGDTTAVSAVGVEEAQKLADFLGKIPNNGTKRYPKLTLKEASIREDARNLPCFISPKTQQDHLQGFSSIFRHAHELDWITANPFTKRAVSSRLPEVTNKESVVFPSDELVKLFSLQSFLDCRHHPKNYPRFWIPLLCFFHGMRANEAAQLLVEDVKQEEGVWFLDIREVNDKGLKVKQLKTSHSNRRLPLSDQFLKTGFLAFIDGQRKADHVYVFSTLTKTKRGSMADAVSKWFSRFRRQVLEGQTLENREKTLHSFRHSFARAGRDAGVPVPIMEALGGWVESSSKKSSHSSYGNGYSLARLKEEIDHVGDSIQAITLLAEQKTLIPKSI